MNARSPLTVPIKSGDLTFLEHALKRVQKRGFPIELATFLIDHGKYDYSHKRRRYTFPGKNAIVPKRLEEMLRKHPCVIVDVEDMVVVTVKWQYERMRRKSGRRRGKGRRR